MANTSQQGTDRAARLARAAKVSGNSGKLCPPDRATALLEAIIELVSDSPVTATTPASRLTACAARRARSRCARSGTWTRWPGLDASMTRCSHSMLTFEKIQTYAGCSQGKPRTRHGSWVGADSGRPG